MSGKAKYLKSVGKIERFTYDSNKKHAKKIQLF